jgi:chromate reductase, NAD(P)H dehydrogenase (quinone)
MSAPDPLKLGVMAGSLRKGSYNAAIARALPILAPAGVTITALPSIRDIPLYDTDLQNIGLPAPVTVLADAVRGCHGVIIVSPEYNYSVPGVLKNAIDWLSRVPDQPFANKPVALQSATMGPLGGARVQYHLRQIFVFLDAQVMNKPEVFVGTAQNKIDASGAITDKATAEFIAGQLNAFADFVRRVGTMPL